MGYSYSNIQIKKGTTAVNPEEIADLLAMGQGLKRVSSLADADIVTAIGPMDAGQWITIVSDIFDEDIEQTCTAAKTLSEKYQTETIAISCVDSDYLCLNLLDAPNQVDAWAACGKYPNGKAPRRSNISEWKNYVPDVETMRNVMRSYHPLAEECLEDLKGMLSLPVSQSQCCTDTATPEQGYQCFYYAAEMSKSTLKPTVFKPAKMNYDTYSFRAVNLVDFVNYSGSSRGVGVFIGGPGITSKQVRVDSTWIQMHDPRGKWVLVPVELKEQEFANGVIGLYGTAPEVRIRETVPDGLPLKKATDIYFERMIAVRFDLSRACKENIQPGDLQVTLIPLQNPAGQAGHVLVFKD